MPVPVSALPGLDWQDIFPARPTLPLTGVPIFFGNWPTDKTGALPERPQRLHLWPQFVEQFGINTPGSFVAAAVRGFFENGGSDCLVYWLKDKSLDALTAALDQIPETADLICAPDVASAENSLALQQSILKHCWENGDRFTILDAPNGDVDVTMAHGQALQTLPGSDYGAMYGPWLKIADSTLPNGTKSVPPCGHVAGVYASCDRTKIPTAPANIPLEGVVDAAMTRAQQTRLAQVDTSPINGIRSLQGRGVRIWGARTLSQDARWRYVNVRRLTITIRRWIAVNLASVAFEPNDFRLWVRIERELTAYLQSLWQRGYLQGVTSNQAFRVRCDGELNPPEVRDRGQVITHIHIALTIPNEFIRLRLIHGETGVAIT